MGSMGPMGPVMGGGSGGSGTAAWPLLALAALLVFALAVVIGYAWEGRGARDQPRPRSPEETLRDRYARGQLTRQQYQDALVDILKDRYVRGEIALDEYEARLGLLLREPVSRSQPPPERVEQPAPRH